jgi:hypothetical protein
MLCGMFSAYLRKAIEERRIKVALFEKEKKEQEKRGNLEQQKQIITSIESKDTI